MSALSWLIDHITPTKYRRQVEQAEADLEASRAQLARVEARGPTVTKLWRELTAERVENHFQERVREAYAGKENK